MKPVELSNFRVITVPALALILAACGGAESDGESAAGGAGETATAEASGGMPQAPEGKTSGTLVGSVAGNQLDLKGTCYASENSFAFWSDGTDFEVNNDTNGDGQYLNVSVISMNDQTMAAMRFHKDGEKVYAGTVPYSLGGSANMTVQGALGREQAITADFTITCG